jgi:hypothetical protein
MKKSFNNSYHLDLFNTNNKVKDIDFNPDKLKYMQKTAFLNSCDKIASFIIKFIESQCCSAASYGESLVKYKISDQTIIKILQKYTWNTLHYEISNRYPNLGTFNIILTNDFYIIINW